MIFSSQRKTFWVRNLVSFLLLLVGSFILGRVWPRCSFPVRFVFTNAFLLFLPGYFLCRILFRETANDVPEKVAVWFMASIVVITLPILIGHLFKLGLSQVIWLTILLIFGLFIGNLLCNGKSSNEIKRAERELRLTREVAFIWGTLALGIVFSVLIFKIGGELGEDTPIHVAMIRKLVERGRIDTADFYFKGSGYDTGYIYESWHPLLAMIAWATEAEPMVIWYAIPSLLTGVAIFSFYSLARTMFNSRKTGFVTIALLVYVLGGLRYNDVGFSELNAPYAVARFILMPMTLYFLFKYLNERKPAFLGLSAFSSLTLATVHMFHWFLYSISLSSFLLFALLLKRGDRVICRRLLTVLIMTVVLATPYLYLRSLNYQIVNPVKASPQVVNAMEYLRGCMVEISDNLYCIHPKYALRMIYVIFYEFSFLPVIAVACAPVFFAYRKEKFGVFLLSQLFIWPFITLNPILVPAITKVITLQYSAIMGQMIPGFLVVGFALTVGPGLLASSLTGLGQLKTKERGMRIVFIILLIVPFLPSILHSPARLSGKFSSGQRIGGVAQREPVHDFLDDLGLSVILSDTYNSAAILQYTKHYVVAIEAAWASASDAEAVERVGDAKTVLNNTSNVSSMKAILRKREVDYILLGPRFSTQALRKKFEDNRALFTRVYDDGNYVVYKVKSLN